MVKKVILISDPHLSENNNLLFGNYNADDSFNFIINRVIKENPDKIILLGDMSQDGSKSSYVKLKNQLDKISCTKYMIPGNHDNLLNLTHICNETIKLDQFVDIYNHRFIFIDTCVKDCDYGYISNSELKKLGDNVSITNINHLIMHHHFIELNGIIDEYILKNPNDVYKSIEKYRINSVFTGHVHYGVEFKINSTNIYHTPSTCCQFDLKKDLQLSPIIGYRIIYVSQESMETYCRLFKYK
jgi:Icc protein